ncbi:MAG TPA: hypothetical protein VGD45_33410 [Steroidobacter sp.]|uniref:hypothetical protein n=1 Tax=Steroidobacter sp. TaxID=1978227 RepID=UPI002EDA981B
MNQHHTQLTFVAIASLVGALACADVDLADFEDDRMEAMDETTKAIDAVIAGRDPTIAPYDIDALLLDLKWTEQYFANKGNAPDAVQHAQTAQKSAAALGDALTQKDYDAAFLEFRALKRSCRNCHDVYKPPSL